MPTKTEIVARLTGDSAQLDATVKRAFQNMQVEAQRAAKSVEPIKRAFNSISSAEMGKMAAAMDRTRGSTANAGMAMLQLGQFADDAQYGIRGIVNNVPSLIQSFGGGVGLAGAIGVAAVAANQLYSIIEKDIKAVQEMGKAAKSTEDLAAGLRSVADEAGRAAVAAERVKAAADAYGGLIGSRRVNLGRDTAGVSREYDALRRQNAVNDEAARIKIEGMAPGKDRDAAEAQQRKNVLSRDAQMQVDEAKRVKALTETKQRQLQSETAGLQKQYAAAQDQAKRDRANAERIRGTSAFAGYDAIARKSQEAADTLGAKLGESQKGLEDYSAAIIEANAAYAAAVQELALLPQKLANVDADLKNKMGLASGKGTTKPQGPGWNQGKGGRFGGIFSGIDIDLDKLSKDALRAAQQDSRGRGRSPAAPQRGPQVRKTFGGLGSATFGGLDELGGMQDANYVLGSGAATSRRTRRGGAPQPFGPGNEAGGGKQTEVLSELRGLRADVRSLREPTKPKVTDSRS